MAFNHSSLNGFILNAWPCPVLGSLTCSNSHPIKHATIRRLHGLSPRIAAANVIFLSHRHHFEYIFQAWHPFLAVNCRKT
jgi:hypothetical protein